MRKAGNKYEFLALLFEKRTLSSQQKERILRLAERDFTEDETLFRIQKIEECIADTDNARPSIPIITDIDTWASLPDLDETSLLNLEQIHPLMTQKKHPHDTTIKKKHCPEVMIKFLHNFSLVEDLKWFTHKYDTNAEFDYAHYLLHVRTLLPKSPTQDFKNINYDTYSNVRNFIGIEKDNQGKFYPCRVNTEILPCCWSSPEVQKWCQQNPGRHPYDAQIKGEAFSTYINKFKNTIEFRADFPDETFHRSCKDFIRNILPADFAKTYTESFDTLGPIMNVYIDRNPFFSGLSVILEWIKQYKARSTNVEFSLTEHPTYYLFEIIHLGSYFSLPKSHPKLKGTQGDFDKARKNFLSVADWEIKTSLGNGECVSIICLDKDTVQYGKENILCPNTIQEIDEQLKGVHHQLKLYKTL